ncbi:hypothetical protein [Lutimonas sp.]|jgi:hypothetical protein|uniref:hypothetical protein n=1 Tax=Lutimonas sp. TaxID=1872403 RepID=UPI003C71490E
MKNLFIAFICLVLFSCKGEGQQSSETNNKTTDQVTTSDTITKEVISEKEATEFVPQSTDEQTANNLKNFLVNDFLKDDISFLEPKDRKFQFYKIDLNDDGNEEIFVRFVGSYFCGSGGCTFLLLDKYGEVITKFTVTRAPIFVESTKVNGWSVLLVKDAGVFKELTFENGSYPSNPSVLPKAPYDAPSGHAQVMFDDSFYKSKTFEF